MAADKFGGGRGRGGGGGGRIGGGGWHKLRTQFEIECRCDGHSVTKKFMTILPILVAKLNCGKIYIFIRITFSI